MEQTAADNTLRIVGHLLERGAIRLTPARIPVVEFRIAHTSRQIEAEVEREVSCELDVRAIGQITHQINALPLGSCLLLQGFICAKTARNRYPVLHVNKIELLEGMNHGFQTNKQA